jgi:hypothetical protein
MYRLRAFGPRLITLFLAVFILIAASVPSADGYQRRRRHNPEAGKGKAAKRIGIGAAIGAGTGALIGGRKGAVIGAGVGAGGGAVYHVHKKRSWRSHHRRG